MKTTENTTNVVIAGLGGQGVIRAANILAEAAMRADYDVKQSEIHGMSQRGGSVSSDVRFGKKVYSPMVPTGEADFVLVLHPTQEENNRYHLKPAGLFLSVTQFLDGESDLNALDKNAATPVTARNCNIALLGTLSNHLPFEKVHWEMAIRNNLPANVHEQNMEAFLFGQQCKSK